MSPPHSSANLKLTAFTNLGLRLSSARTQKDAIQIILDIADRFFGWDACTFDSFSEDEGLVRAVIVVDRIDGRRRDVEPVVKQAPPTARMREVIESGAKLILRHGSIQMPPDAVPMGDRNRPSASIMYVPVRAGRRVIGLLSIQSYREDAYDEADLELLQSLADHGAGALERIQAEERIKALNAELEERISARTAELQAMVQELEALSYSLSHDMRSPLRAMQGYAVRLLEDYSGKTLDETAADFLARIARSAQRLDSLIQDVLSYNKMLRADATIRPVNLEHLIRDLVQMCPEWQPPDAKIEIVTPLPMILGNEGLLTQCIANLVQNAVKFVAPGVSPKVKIWAELSQNVVRLWVEDNGIGIARENRDRVFRLFERVYPCAEFEGTGLGLAIVQKAVQRMHGAVGFTSEPGTGSKFWLDLPRLP